MALVSLECFLWFPELAGKQLARQVVKLAQIPPKTWTFKTSFQLQRGSLHAAAGNQDCLAGDNIFDQHCKWGRQICIALSELYRQVDTRQNFQRWKAKLWQKSHLCKIAAMLRLCERTTSEAKRGFRQAESAGLATLVPSKSHDFFKRIESETLVPGSDFHRHWLVTAMPAELPAVSALCKHQIWVQIFTP